MSMGGREVTALIIALLVFGIWNINIIAEVLPSQEKTLILSLCSAGSEAQHIDLAKRYVDERVYVPDYTANISVGVDDTKLGDYAQISVRIKNNGIEELRKPFFYLLLFNPDDNVEAIFPCFSCHASYPKCEPSIKFKIGSYRSQYWSLDNNKRLDGWESVGCSCDKLKLCPEGSFRPHIESGQCLPRNDFLSGTSNGSKIVYSYQVKKPGTWKVYLFLSDDEYYNRKAEKIRDTQDLYYKNSIDFGYSSFEVTSEPPKEEGFVASISKLSIFFSLLIGFISFYQNFNFGWCYDVVTRYYTQNRYFINIAIILSLLITLLNIIITSRL